MRHKHPCLALAMLCAIHWFQPADGIKPEIPVDLPPQWVEAPALLSGQATATLQSRMPDRRWWLAFQDNCLSEYIQTAITNSPNLRASLERIAQARAQVRQAIGDQLPVVKGAINGGQVNIPSELHKNIKLPIPQNNPLFSSFNNLNNLSPFSLKRLNFLTLLGSASYEADIWGKYWDITKSARKEVQASEADTRASEVMLQAEVAMAYFDLLRAEALYCLTERIVDKMKETRDLMALLYQNGLETIDNLLRIERDIAEREADLNAYKQNMSLAAHELSTLTGMPPQTYSKMPRSRLEQVTVPVCLDTGLPLVVIAQRPDVAAQELRLERAGINVRVARKKFLPTIRVSDFFGFTAVKGGQVLDGSSFINAIIGNGEHTFFQGGKVLANLRLEQARQREQIETYRQTILTALKEVEDSLSKLLRAYEDQETNDQERKASSQVLQVTQALYQNGLRARLDVLKAENELLLREVRAIQAKTDKLVATVELYKALGGGY